VTEFPTQLLALARQGQESAVGELLGMFRGYFKLLARLQLRARPGLGEPSDFAQEAVVRAFKAFKQFRGTTEAELTSWLRKILSRCLADAHRRQRPEARPAQTAAQLDRSSHHLAEASIGAIDRLDCVLGPRLQSDRGQRAFQNLLSMTQMIRISQEQSNPP
jgi:DNA-directed RNA polymerase specialized sigma24 family protein